ncbi:hypothetical protein COCCADRAFT_38960 [Bipolaris zeicola 26-R-13]|uniref:EXS domain-containing protein n=1 Tax=Cochliobolus carbonum (strain 26-R-13) TaxID=930089 RepID=W6XTF5_COCC2|nr:uncharacterized protein COCCADRAFT_38960 [Bipolaris zeicola 26-R-13]EUC30882.1 hypothetical protein COCCADRAFT_38960 [Bipolaris zeicola 26-R-13]
MGFWDKNEDNYQKVYENENFEEHKSSLGHEMIAGGAAFAGFKAFEDHQRKEGKPVSHQFAKELLAGFAGAEIDKLAETKGEDWFDREKAKRDAKQHAERMYDEHYIDNHGADQYDPNQYGAPESLQSETGILRASIRTAADCDRELERDLVPEWRLKYLDYKLGKKKLKAIDRALRHVESTPRLRRRGGASVLPSPLDAAPKYTYLNREHTHQGNARDTEDLRALAITNTRSRNSLQRKADGGQAGQGSQLGRTPEEEPLNKGQRELSYLGSSYGSFAATSPPNGTQKGFAGKSRAPPSLKLPGAALDPEHVSPHVGLSGEPLTKTKTVTLPPPAELETDNAFEVGKTRAPNKSHHSLPAKYKSVFSPKRMNSTPGPVTSSHPRPSVRRLFSASNRTPPASPGDVPLEAYRDFDFRQAEFFNFLDGELDKIERFYKQKEDEATDRLAVLRDQLHIMRDRRIDDIIQRQTDKINAKIHKKHEDDHILSGGQNSSRGEEVQHSWVNSNVLKDTLMSPVDAAFEAINAGKYGKSTKNIAQLTTPAALRPRDHPDSRRDFARRPDLPEVPYKTAKRKLKIALQEYYRGLELLKAYALLNRTAFRKINKKYDKTVNARPTSRYMNEKVNQAWFVNSDVIEGHIRTVEDLYARYFEKGNHKVAVNKLRVKTARAGDYTDNTFRNGLLLAAGTILALQGIIKANSIADLYDPSPSTLAVDTSYLLQIYAGYFIVNFLTLLFCLACRVWHENKINYVFIFEYDTRHHLDWRQLAEWRLILAGVYPVEWRDFYMGDMFCSLTYSMSNIAMFFCLYAHDWNYPPQCNSSHLRITGFLSALPGVWRLLQCLRRYKDTGNKFPHLLNGGKYTATILFNATLSIHRMDSRASTKAAYITFGIINGIYTSFWDIYYDWSLGDPRAKYPFLRKELGYKKAWWYYTAMCIDPILRNIWVLYTIVPLQNSHPAVTSFVVSLLEVLRRGMWSVFRVENEHCTNVGRFRASRDVPLPYYVPSNAEVEEDHTSGIPRAPTQVDEEQPGEGQPPTPTEAGPRRPATATGSELDDPQAFARKRRGVQDEFRPSPLQRAFTHVGDIFRDAHAEDFERKLKPELGRDPRSSGSSSKLDDDSDDESDNDEEAGELVNGSRSNSDGARSRDSDGEDDVEAEVHDEEEMSALARIREDFAIGVTGAHSDGTDLT